jgi:DnaJ-class molecular chaperone
MTAAGEDPARLKCTPCRGTGQVISALGGNPHDITCPWCDGTGVFQRGRDAQDAVVPAPSE